MKYCPILKYPVGFDEPMCEICGWDCSIIRDIEFEEIYKKYKKLKKEEHEHKKKLRYYK